MEIRGRNCCEGRPEAAPAGAFASGSNVSIIFVKERFHVNKHDSVHRSGPESCYVNLTLLSSLRNNLGVTTSFLLTFASESNPN